MSLMFIDVFYATDCTSSDIYMEINECGLAFSANSHLIQDQRVKSRNERRPRGKPKWLKAP